MAAARLLTPTMTIPFLYDTKRTVREVVKALLSHDFGKLEMLCPGSIAWGHARVPSWTKDLAERMERREITATEINLRMGRPKGWRPDPTHIMDAITFAFRPPRLADLAIKAVPGSPIDLAREKGAARRAKAYEVQEAARLEADATHENLLRHKAGHAPKYTPILSLNSLLRILADIDKLGNDR
jgi:hypothetical protein